jgi:hypothetical protein
MSGIFNGNIRFMHIRLRIAAIELAETGDYCVMEIQDGACEIGDELVGNLDRAGAVDLFNRTRHDRLHGDIRRSGLSREDAIRELQKDPDPPADQ